MKVIGPLTDPAAHGGDAGRRVPRRVPVAARLRLQRQADRDRLGRRRIAEGVGRADGRASATSATARRAATGERRSRRASARRTPGTAPASTSTCPSPARDPATWPTSRGRSRRPWPTLAYYQDQDSGYSKQQATRPQTLGYGLVDSPAGQAAWIIEKFWAWTDYDGHPENAVSRDELLDNVMLYWLTGTGASSARLYWESFSSVRHRSTRRVPDRRARMFPKEIIAAVAALGRAAVHRHPLLERARPGRPLRRLRRARPLRRRDPRLLPTAQVVP